MFDGLMAGFAVATTGQNLLLCLAGAFLGTVVGVLPGLGPTAAIALLLPISVGLDVTGAIILLAGIYYGVSYGGTITSVLMRIPGEASTVVTCLDGYEMARRGRAGAALGVAAIGSFIAGTFGIVGLTVMAPVLGNAMVAFGPSEYAALMFAGLCLVTFFSQSSFAKAILMAAVGLLLGAVGEDPITGEMRMTFGQPSLVDGIDVSVLAIGLFGLSEILNLARMPDGGPRIIPPPSKIMAFLPSPEERARSVWPIARGTVLGFLLGLLPGGGAVLGSFVSYAVEKRLSPRAAEFGTGAIEGVAGPESANNSATAGAFIPLLTLGIPANAVTALLLAAFLMHGVVPGPLIMQDHPKVFWGVVASMYIGNVMLVILNVPLIGLFVKALEIPRAYIAPTIIAVCVAGVFAADLSTFDVAMTIAFGFIGYFLRRSGFDPGPLILAFVLGPTFERALRQMLLITDGDLIAGFMHSGISAFFIALGIIILVTGLSGWKRKSLPSAD